MPRAAAWLVPLLLAVNWRGADATNALCACSCCSKTSADHDCSAVIMGHNTLPSCSLCDTNYCSRTFEECPASGSSGGTHGIGGHNVFNCDESDGGGGGGHHHSGGF